MTKQNIEIERKNNNNLAKGALISAAVLAGGAAAVALKDGKNRKKVGATLKNIQKKGIEFKEIAEEWVQEHRANPELLEKSIAKAQKAAR